MKVKKLIGELIKFKFKIGNLGVVRWKQFAGFVNVTGFDVRENKVNVQYNEYAPRFHYGIFDKKVNDLIKDLVMILYKYGNLDVEMYWNETDGSNPRTGYLPITTVCTDINKRYCEIA